MVMAKQQRGQRRGLYTKLWADDFDSPATVIAARRLGTTRHHIVGLKAGLVMWAMKHREDGRVGEENGEVIDAVLEWNGEVSVIEGFTASGIIDRDGYIVGWELYAKHLFVREYDRERKQADDGGDGDGAGEGPVKEKANEANEANDQPDAAHQAHSDGTPADSDGPPRPTIHSPLSTIAKSNTVHPAGAGRTDDHDDHGKRLKLAFTEFWAIYPKKVNRARAQKCWTKAVNADADPGDIYNATTHYVDACAARGQQVKDPSVWLGTDEPWREWVSGDPDDADPATADSTIAGLADRALQGRVAGEVAP